MQPQTAVSSDQWLVILRYLLSTAGGYAVGKGWLTTSDMSALTSVLIQLATAAVPAAMTIWALLKTTKSAKIASAQALPDVQVITTDPKAASAGVTLAKPGEQVTVTAPKS